MQKCTDCKEIKSVSEFSKNKRYKSGVNSVCKKCMCIRTTNYMRKKYTGFTKEEYDTTFIKQKGCCSICGKHQSKLKISLSADHCHSTGNKRGLLCPNCNRGLGSFADSIETLKKAIKYLRKHSK